MNDLRWAELILYFMVTFSFLGVAVICLVLWKTKDNNQDQMPGRKDVESAIEPYESPGDSFTITDQHERHKHYKGSKGE